MSLLVNDVERVRIWFQSEDMGFDHSRTKHHFPGVPRDVSTTCSCQAAEDKQSHLLRILRSG